MTDVCACDAHTVAMQESAPDDAPVQIIPIPNSCSMLEREQLEQVLAVYEPGRDPRAMAVELELPRLAVLGSLRMAGVKV